MSDLKYFEKLDNVDSLISLANATGYEQTFLGISNYFDNPYIIKYFFEKIDTERWVDSILNSEFIKKYRSGEIEEIDNNQFDWFFMSYLLKVADKVPNQVSDYLKSIAAIDDVGLHERTIEVMLKLPCDIAADLAKNEIEWCKTKDNLYGLYPELAGKLILHIRECNEEIAFELIKQLLMVYAVTREVGKLGTESYYKTTDIKAKFSDWEYQSILDKYISKFVLNSDNNFNNLKYLFELLTNVLSLEKREPENDYSWVWRSTFEDNEQTRHISGIKEMMLITLRDLCIDLINEDNKQFNKITQILNNYEWTALKRLSIYLSVKFPKINLELTKDLISNTELYESSRTRNEYSLLLKSAFSLVGKDVQNAVYSWIDNGVDLKNYVTRYKEHKGIQPNEEKIEDYKSYWKKNRLHLIRSHLEGERLESYQSLVKDKGEPDHPEYSSYSTSWVGPTSPMTDDEINELGIEKLIQELKEWVPSGESMAPSPEGFSRKLSQAIKANIDKYKHSASLFIELPPTYIRGVFQGFRDNISNLDEQSWSEIFILSEWVLSQDDDIEAEQDIDSDEDKGWSWCRKSIASLLDAGLTKGKSQIPIDLKDEVWRLLLVLSKDPDPTPAYEAEYGGSNMGPTTLAINTVRGEAMHALIEYGLWVGRNTKNKKISFDDIPELKEALEEHLEPDNDPSLAIRSVYGQFYPWLNLLDTNWASENKNKIFSDDLFGLGDAAWDAYITYCSPYDDTFAIIKDVYIKYSEKLAGYEESDDRERTLENLAAHIITFYWRSKLDLDSEIFKVFYQHAPLKVRKYAINFIGRSLGSTPNVLEDNIETRLKGFYEWRQACVNETKEYEELADFCWWIDANVIDKEWALNKFHELLQVQDELDSLDFAASKLINYLDIEPKKVLECLDMMLDKLNTKGMYFSWDNDAQEILRVALLKYDVKEQAIDLVHKFGSKGFLKYRELLGIQ